MKNVKEFVENSFANVNNVSGKLTRLDFANSVKNIT